MKVLGLIPARKGSKGIPNKNLVEFCGKPLISWTVDAALESGIFDSVVVSTDYDLKQLPKMNGITVYDKRPAGLSGDRVALDKTLSYIINKFHCDIIVLLQPTSPLRTSKDIKKAFTLYCKSGCDSLISVTPQHQFIWVDQMAKVEGKIQPVGLYNPEKRPNRQSRKEWFAENGAIYITKASLVKLSGCRINGTVVLYPMGIGVEIDNQVDFKTAKAIYAIQ